MDQTKGISCIYVYVLGTGKADAIRYEKKMTMQLEVVPLSNGAQHEGDLEAWVRPFRAWLACAGPAIMTTQCLGSPMSNQTMLLDG